APCSRGKVHGQGREAFVGTQSPTRSAIRHQTVGQDLPLLHSRASKTAKVAGRFSLFLVTEERARYRYIWLKDLAALQRS
ncbi:MAG: hypothetical protein ABJF16_18720, partial [Lentilitoribacter sp.]